MKACGMKNENENNEKYPQLTFTRREKKRKEPKQKKTDPTIILTINNLPFTPHHSYPPPPPRPPTLVLSFLFLFVCWYFPDFHWLIFCVCIVFVCFHFYLVLCSLVFGCTSPVLPHLLFIPLFAALTLVGLFENFYWLLYVDSSYEPSLSCSLSCVVLYYI